MKIAGPLIEYGFGAALGERRSSSQFYAAIDILCSSTTLAPKYNLLLDVGRHFALKFKNKYFKPNCYFLNSQSASLDDGWLG